MSRQFMAYWKPQQIESLMNAGETLNHAASNQYKRCQKGDVVWIVTLRNGRLHLVGKIPVKAVVNYEEACRHLKRDDLWEADFHIVSDVEGGDPVRQIEIHRLAEHLRFIVANSQSLGRILMQDGLISGTALQTMRELTPDSAEMLESELRNVDSLP